MEFGRPQVGERLRLGLRNLYIVPTRFGWFWLAGLVLLKVVGIQMQSNGPLLLSFLMLGLFLLALHLTHFNLQGLELAVGDPQPGHARSGLSYPLRLRCPGRCEGLRLRFGREPLGPVLALPAGEHRLSVPWSPQRRGLQSPGILHLQTTAPLGLFICWSRWEPTVPQLIYPAQRPGPVAIVNQASEEQDNTPSRQERQEGCDEWRDLQPHRPEEGSARLAWKLVAQGRGRYSKRFSDSAQPLPLLAPDPAVPFERALEHLSEQICRLHGRGDSYGLVLRGERIPAGRGLAQRQRALAALARCPGEPTSP
ncbi:MAG: hypothetical protein WAM11_10375 [Cyanobium sp.]